MNFIRMDFLQLIRGMLAGGVLSSVITLIIVLILWFWARGAITNAIESIFPGEFGKIATNLIFGLLALYFLIKLLGNLSRR